MLLKLTELHRTTRLQLLLFLLLAWRSLSLLRSDVLAAFMKWSKTSVKDWVKTLFMLTIVNVLFTSSVTLSIKMCS